MNTKNWGWLLGGAVCVCGAVVIGMGTGVAQISLPQSVQSLTQTLKNTQIIRDDGAVSIELNKNGVIDILDGALRDKSIVLDDIDISTLSIGKKHECGADEAIVGIDNDKKVVCQGIEIGSLWSSHDKGKSSIYVGAGTGVRVAVGDSGSFRAVDDGLLVDGDVQSDKAIILGKDEGLALVAPSSPAAIRHTKSLIVGRTTPGNRSIYSTTPRVGFGKSVPEKEGLDIGGGLRVDGKSYIRHNGRNGAVTSWIAHVGDDKTIWSASRSGGSAKVGLVSPQVVVGGHMDSSGQIKTPGLRGDSLSVWGDMSAVSFSFHGYNRRTVGSLNPDNDIPEECVALSLDGNKQVVLVNVCDRPVNGVCAQSGTSATKPTGKLCTAGKAPADVTVTPDKKGWTWTCAGRYGGADKVCRVNVTWKVEQPTGACGTGGVRTRKVTCITGMTCPQSKPSNKTTHGCTASWTLVPTWSTCTNETKTKTYNCPTNRYCTGTKPTAQTQSCPTGVCGIADGKSYTSAPATSLRCSVGSVINFSGGTNGSRKWNCRGVNGGATSKQCEATKKVVSTITKCSDMQKVDISKILNPSGHARLLSNVGEIQLTDDRTWQVGSAISKHKIDLKNDFTFSYDVYLGTKDSGADGLSFILHNDPRGAAAVGGAGHNMGAIGIKNGIFVEFDTHDNKRQMPGTEDIPDDHTQIRRTSVPFSHTDSKLSSIVGLGNIEDARRHSVVFRRKASTKTFSYSVDGITGPTLTDSDMYNKYFGGGSEVYFGFAGSTGDRSNRQKVRLKSFFESVQQVSGAGTSDCQTRK